MFTREQLLSSMLHEVSIMKHLTTKVLPGTEGYKPTEKQRTLVELMGFLTNSTSTLLTFIRTGDMSVFNTADEARKLVTFENFSAKMDEEAERIKKSFSEINDEMFAEEVDIWNSGMKVPRSLHYLETVLKGMTAYRMQLFLYIKASGRADIGTSNLWMGQDEKK